MPVCKNCGKENLQEARFCNNCGTVLTIEPKTCAHCGKILEEYEKFCSACGKQVNIEKPVHEPTPPPPVPTPAKKKKKGCLGCFFKGILILILILVGAIAVIYFTTDWIDQFMKEWDKIKIENTGSGSSSGTLSPETKTPASSATEAPSGISKTDSKNIQAIAGAVEEVFAKSDTVALKSILTEASVEKYRGVYAEILPYMQDYAKAFKSRKLIWSNAFYAVYSFRDDQGTSFSAEFALNKDGNWKLVRF